MSTTKRTFPITELPTTLRIEDAVEAACAADIAFAEEKLQRGTSVLVECDKELTFFLYLAVRARFRRNRESPKLVVIDGRPAPDQPSRGNLPRMMEQLTEAIRGAIDKTVIVMPHLDVLTTTHTGLTLEAREVIPLLYENPEVLLLGFRDPSFEVPKVIRDVFPAKREITGTPREALTKLLTQREAKAINSDSFDPFALYKYVSGLNPVRCRRLFSDFANRMEATSGRPREQEIYAELRKQTVSDGVELPNVKLDTDIGGYTEVKTRLKEELIDLLVRKDTLTDPSDVAQMESLLPRGMIFHGPPGTGKTYFAKAIATAINATVHVVSGPELKSKWVGESLPWDEEVLVIREGKARRVPIGELVDSDYDQPKVRPETLTWTASDKGRAKLAPVSGYIRHKGPDYIDVLTTETGRRVRVTGGHSLFVLKDGKLADIPAEEVVPGETRVAVPLRLKAPETIVQLDVAKLLSGRTDVRVLGYDKIVTKAIEEAGASRVRDIIGMSHKRITSDPRRAPLSIASFEKIAELSGENIKSEALSLYCWHRNKTMPGILPLTEDLAEFFGWWVAEGSYNGKTGVRLSLHEDEVEHVAGLCKRLFGTVTIYRKKINGKNSNKGSDIYINSTLLYLLMHDGLGMRDGSNRQHVPGEMFLAPLPIVAAFLKGYFSGDGYFSGKYIEAGTTSRRLAEDVSTLLQYFGILARLRFKAERTGSTTHRVRFGWSEFLRIFAEKIGFVQAYKQDAVRHYVNNQGLKRDVQTPAQHITNDVYWDTIVEKKREAYAKPHVYDLSVPGTERFIAGFGNILVHNSEEQLRRIFRVARQSAPSVIIFDEIDSFAHQRGSYSGSGVEHSMVNQLLTEMDGFRKNEMVFVVATTNFLESLDGALMRPGRFEFMIEIPAPSAEDREAIIRIYDARFGLKLSDDVIKHLVRRTEGMADREKGLPFAGDHIQAVARALKRQQLRSGKLEVTTDDIDKALQRKTRKPIVLSAEEEKVIATHEAGHALLAMLIPNATLPERITIASDMDGALGYVQRAARTKPYALTGKDLRAEICVALGGNVAEKLAFGETSVGAANDLRAANAIARSMVENYGMTEGLGMCVVGDPKEPVSQHLSEQRDREVSAILKSEYERATTTLTENKPMLDALVALLLERKTLDATALKSLKPEA